MSKDALDRKIEAGMQEADDLLATSRRIMAEAPKLQRRYALLQAAAQQLPKLVMMTYEVGVTDKSGFAFNSALARTVQVAEQLLAEIELREKEREKEQL